MLGSGDLRVAGVFVFSLLFLFLLSLRGLVQRGLAVEGREGILKARDKLSNNQRSLGKQIECLARG